MRRAAALASAALLGCGLTAVGLRVDDGNSAPDSDASADATSELDGARNDDGATGDASIEADAVVPAPKPTIYLSNTTELWKFEPVTKAFAKVADFTSCSGGIEEIAVDANGAIVATREDNGALFTLGGANGATCIGSVDAPMPFALTFAPKGTLQANVDTLVGYNGGGDYVRYDRSTGASSVVKAGALGGYRPRGDVTSGPAGKGYVAAIAGDGSVSCPTDCLVEVDLTTGDVIRKVTQFPSGQVYGIAFSDGKVHGFASNANVDVITLAPLTIETIAPDASVPAFRGAGASTAGF